MPTVVARPDPMLRTDTGKKSPEKSPRKKVLGKLTERIILMELHIPAPAARPKAAYGGETRRFVTKGAIRPSCPH